MAQRSRSLGGRWFTFGAEEREKREDGGGHSWVGVLWSLFSGRGWNRLAVTESDAHTGLVLTTAET